MIRQISVVETWLNLVRNVGKTFDSSYGASFYNVFGETFAGISNSVCANNSKVSPSSSNRKVFHNLCQMHDLSFLFLNQKE